MVLLHALGDDASSWDRVAQRFAERYRVVALDLRGHGASDRPGEYAFEQLRDEPARTKVFLATMGTVAAHTARATFAANLLAAGGIDVVNEGRHDDVAAVLAHYGGEPVVCLVGPNAAYDDWGADLIARLREAGAHHVIVAGKPKDLDVDDSCAVGVDALAFLRRTREVLG